MSTIIRASILIGVVATGAIAYQAFSPGEAPPRPKPPGAPPSGPVWLSDVPVTDDEGVRALIVRPALVCKEGCPYKPPGE